MTNLPYPLQNKTSSQICPQNAPEVDSRFERLFEFAASYCGSDATTALVEYLSNLKDFPSMNDKAGEQNESPENIYAYNITLASFALLRRADFHEYLTPENKENITQLINKSYAAVGEALKLHDDCMRRYEPKGKCGSKRDSSLFFGYLYSHRDLYNHMILFHAVPEFYGPQAAPLEYVKALKFISGFWAKFIDSGDRANEEFIFSRWLNGGDKDRFDCEFTQLAFGAQFDPTYTEEQVHAFRHQLVVYLMKTGGTRVFTRYHPCAALEEAGHQSGIRVGMTTFPSDITTHYTDFPEKPGSPNLPRVVLYLDKCGEPFVRSTEIGSRQTAKQRNGSIPSLIKG